jgi:CHAD domain-containing protein
MNFSIDRSAVTLGDWAYQAIAKHFHKILKHEAGVLKDRDAEELHQMRVGVRRLRSALVSVEKAIILPASLGEKAVGNIGKKLGVLRDLDVMGATLGDRYLPLLPPTEQKSLRQGIKHLQQARVQSLKATQKLLKSDRYLTFKTDFQDWLVRPKYQAIAELPMDYVLPDLLSPTISHFLLHRGWWVGDGIEELASVPAVLHEEGAILHDLRKEAKRARYTLELFTPLYGDRYGDYLQRIRAVQEVLGELQDGEVLAAFMTETFHDSLRHILPTLEQILLDRQLQGWQTWQDLRSQWVDQHDRLAWHEVLLHPTPVSSRQLTPST